MKVAISLFALVLTAAFAQAGSFGGPRPFTNGSTLVTGVDGSYQATARNTNLTGIFRFTYVNGRQASNTGFPAFNTSVTSLLLDPYNDYVFFVEGYTYRGLTQANINGGSISGVLDNGSANAPNYFADVGDIEQEGLAVGAPTFGTVTIPGTDVQASTTPAGSTMAGEFNGTIDTSSSNYAFSGNGTITVTGYGVALVITDFEQEPPPDASVSITFTPSVIPITSFNRTFNFRGIRNSQNTSSSTTGT